MSAILCCRTSPRPPRLRFSPRWARGNPLVLPCSQIWVWCTLARFPMVSGELLAPAMENHRAGHCSGRPSPLPHWISLDRGSTIQIRRYLFAGFYLKESLCFSRNKPAVQSASQEYAFSVLKTYSAPVWIKIRFQYLLNCHWFCFGHKIFMLISFWPIQIALDSY